MDGVRDNVELMRLVCSFGRLVEVLAVRACSASWRGLLEPAHPATSRLFRRVAAPFNRRFSGSATFACVATFALVELRCPGTPVRDENLAVLGRLCPGLEVMDVSRCEGVGDAGLAWVAWGCPRLTSLDVSLSPRVTDAGVASVASRCPALTWLGVRHDPLVGDAALAAVAAGCPRLASLFAAHSGAGAEGAVAVGLGCPVLEEASFTCCGTLNDSALAALSSHRPGGSKLRTLDISYDDLVTDFGLSLLRAGAPNLSRLDIWGCSRVSGAAVEALQLGGVEVSHELASAHTGCNYSI
jgi:hypothetical protein